MRLSVLRAMILMPSCLISCPPVGAAWEVLGAGGKRWRDKAGGERTHQTQRDLGAPIAWRNAGVNDPPGPSARNQGAFCRGSSRLTSAIVGGALRKKADANQSINSVLDFGE
jgi:hypothetical protein